MATVFGPILLLISAALLAGTGADGSMKAAHNTTVELTCTALSSETFLAPAWFMDGSITVYEDGYRSSRDEDAGELIGTLTINGNQKCGTFLCSCRLSGGETMHNFTMTVEGPLPSPENVHINESNGFVIIKWNPPYSANNAESGVVHVEPHITHYTVYIVDNYTGNYIERVDVTETSVRRNTPNDNSCPVYHVTAWNSGGEGDMSVLLPGAPRSIAAEDVDILRESGALDIRLHVTDPCTVRIPNYFLVTVISTDGVLITTVQHQHPITTVHITTVHVTLPQNVDECNLNVRINAGNSAGMSSPTEITINGCQTTEPMTATTHYTTTSLPVDTTTSDLGDPRQQGNYNIIYIAIGIPVGAVVIVTTAALLLIVLWKCKRTTKVEPPGENVYSKSPSLGGPPIYQPDSPPVYSPPAVYANTESHSRTSSTQSSGSDKPLLPPEGAKSAIQVSTGVSGVVVSLRSSTTSYARSGPQAPEGNPQLVYARIDPAKHSQPLPPASDNQVQYAQIDYQEKL